MINLVYYIVLSVGCLSTQMSSLTAQNIRMNQSIYKCFYFHVLTAITILVSYIVEEPERCVFLILAPSVWGSFRSHKLSPFILCHSDHRWATISHLSVSISLCKLVQQYNFVCCGHIVYLLKGFNDHQKNAGAVGISTSTDCLKAQWSSDISYHAWTGVTLQVPFN